jgi:pimeloyl-ACP methyl ester carboxylesterase
VNAGSQIAQTNCGPIEYATAGNGPPALVVHGAGGGFDQGLEVARLLIESGFQVIAPSRFGYLRTPMPEKRDRLAETQADAHACLLDTLKLSKVAVFGASAGAPSSMRLCLKRPERCSALVLMVPGYPATPTGEQRELSAFARFFLETTLRSDFIFWALISIAPDMMTRMVLGTPPEDVKHASPDEQARVREVLWHILPVSRRADGLRHEAASIANAPGPEELKAIKTPTLLISAENDLYGTYAPAQSISKQIPNARFIGYPTGGHLLVGHEAEAWREISNFIRQRH